MKLKSALALFLALCMVFTLCACGDAKSPSGSKTNEPAVGSTEQPTSPDKNEPTEAPEEEEPSADPITGLTLSDNSVELTDMGESFQLEATLTPDDAAAPIAFTSTDPKVVTVDKSGLVTATGRGVATVTAACEGFSAICIVTCNISISSLEFANPQIELTAQGQTHPLSVLADPAELEYMLSYTTDDPAIATVDENGVVTAVGRGSATITVTDGVLSTTCTVVCDWEPVWQPADLTFVTGENGKYEATYPINHNGGKVTLYNGNIPAEQISFSSSSPSIATVDKNGVVTLRAMGHVVITAAYNGWSIKFNLTVGEAVYTAADLHFYADDATYPLSWGTFQLYTGEVPADKVTFFSSDTSVVTVDSTGKITFVGKGTARVTARYNSWTATAIVRVS